MSDCDGVTDASLISLGRCCNQLISIDVGRCKNITDRGLEGYADCCRNVTAESYPDVSHSCYLLSNTDVSRRKEIADKGISGLAHRCSLLRNINIGQERTAM